MRFQEINGVLIKYFSKMTIDEILKELEVEFQKRPNGRTLKLLGFGYFHSGNLDNAIQAFTNALKRKGEDPVAIYESLGRCYILKGDWNQAEQYFSKSHRFDFEFFLDLFGREFLCVTSFGRHLLRPPIFGGSSDEFSERALQIELQGDALSIQYGNKKGHKSLFSGQLESMALRMVEEYASNHQKANQDIASIRNDAFQLLQELKTSTWLSKISDEIKHGLIITTILVTQDYFNLGVYLAGQNRLAEAENAYRKAIASDSKIALAYSNLGVLLADQNRLVGRLA